MRPTKARPRCWSYRRNTRRRSPAIDASNSAPLAINSRGQETRTDRSVAGLTYTLQRTFDAAGNLRTLTYPDGEVVTYQYGTSGGFTGMTSTLTYQGAQPVPLVSGAYATPWGAPGGFVLGAATPLTTR